VIFGVVAVVVLVAVGGYFVTRSEKSYPKAWDPQVAPIADKVSEMRGLSFEHKVPIRYLSDEEFKKLVAVDSTKLTASDRKEIENLATTLRALGLIDAGTDLLESFDTAQQSGTLAFYSPTKEEIVVRGTGPFDVEKQVTVAHELTHVLQDQHFDLQELRHNVEDSETASQGAFTAMIEGDAERIKFEYLRGLPKAERDAYVAAETKLSEGIDAEMKDVAQIVQISLGAPYSFGPAVIRALIAEDGNHAVDEALQRDDPTDEIYLDPAAALSDRESVDVPVPSVSEGDHRVGEPDNLGPFDLYTVLATRLDRQVALDAADTWAGDRMVTYKSGEQECVKATIVSKTPEGAQTMADALSMWAAKRPGSSVEENLDRKRSTLTACDSGAVVAPDPTKLDGAMVLLAARNDLLASFLDENVPVAVSECVSRALTRTQIFVTTFERPDGAMSPTELSEAQAATRSLIQQCGGA
jgi:Zn-dependent peptidase ImmA (M78 family)